jgi:hypothetical protein
VNYFEEIFNSYKGRCYVFWKIKGISKNMSNHWTLTHRGLFQDRSLAKEQNKRQRQNQGSVTEARRDCLEFQQVSQSGKVKEY